MSFSSFFVLQSADSVVLPDGMETIGSKTFANSIIPSVYLPAPARFLFPPSLRNCKRNIIVVYCNQCQTLYDTAHFTFLTGKEVYIHGRNASYQPV